MTTPHFSKENSFVQSEGTCFDNRFGTAKFSDFKTLAFIEHSSQGFEIEVMYCYRITANHYIQWITLPLLEINIEIAMREAIENPHNIICQYRFDDDLTFKENLLIIFAEFIHHRSLFDGRITNFKSDIISIDEFNSIQQNINSRKQRFAKSALLEFLKNEGLNPLLHDDRKGLYTSNCVRSSHHLLIKISQEKEEWECGYCRKKGSLEDLKQWILEKKQAN